MTIPHFKPTGPSVADIRGELNDLVDDAGRMLDRVAAENRDLSDEENVAFGVMQSNIEATQKRLRAAEADRDRRLAIAEATSTLRTPSQSLGFVRASGLSPLGTMNTSAHIAHKLPNLKSFKGPNAHGDAYDAGHWLAAIVARSRNCPDEAREEMLRSRGLDVRMAMTEGDPTKGGYTVPTPLSNTLIDVRADVGVARRTARIHPLSSETETVPQHTGATTVYYPGEAGEITASDETFGQIQLTAKKRAILAKISRELKDDAIISIVDQLAYDMGHSLATKEDAEYILGDGTSTYGGVTGLLAAQGAGGLFTPANGVGLSVWSGLTNTEITATMAKLPSKYQTRGPVFISSSEFFYGVLMRLMAAAGGNSMSTLAEGIGVGSFLGKPVFFTDHMPKTTAVSQVSLLYGSFGDAAMLGNRQGIDIAISDQRYFETDQIGVKATTRYDINVFDAGTASAAGAFVGLKTAAS